MRTRQSLPTSTAASCLFWRRSERWDITSDTLLTDLSWKDGKQTVVSRFGEREAHYKAGVYDGVWKACGLNRSPPLERLKPKVDKEARATLCRLWASLFLRLARPATGRCTRLKFACPK